MRRIIFFVMVSFFVFGILQAYDVPKNPSDLVITVTVQPFSKTETELFLNNVHLAYTMLAADKTRAVLRSELCINKTSASPQTNEKNRLEVRRKDFRSQTFLLEEGKNAFSFCAVLDREDSSLRFHASYQTDGTPKSVRFIGNDIVVTLLNGRGFNVINAKTGETRLVSPPEKYAKQEGFVESLYLAERGELWISQMTTDCIHIFSVPDFAYLTTVQCSGTWGKVMAYNKPENAVYFTNWISHDISIIDVDTRKEKAKRKIGAVPRGVVFSDDGTIGYFAQFESADGSYGGKTLAVRLADFHVIGRYGKSGAKRHLAKDRRRLYVSDMSRCIVEVFSLADGTLLAEIPVGDNPNTICLGADGTRLYVSCRGKNHPTKGYLYKGLVFGELYVIDTDTLKTVEVLEGGNQPTGLDISADGSMLCFSNFLDNEIRLYDIVAPRQE